MEVFKFGGASVKDAEGVRRLAGIVNQHDGRLVIVVSAMGKMTNFLEKIHEAYFRRDARAVAALVVEFRHFHETIADELFPAGATAREHLQKQLGNLEQLLDKEPSSNRDREYDRVIPFGEILSTTIVSDYLAAAGISNRFIDVRRSLISDSCYRNANINLKLSTTRCRKVFNFRDTTRYVTQGFIAGTRLNETTTLGR